MVKPLIAIVMNSLPLGGAERVVVSLIRELLELDTKIDLVLKDRKGAMLNEVPCGARVLELGRATSLAPLPSLLSIGAISWTHLLYLRATRVPGTVRNITKIRDYFDNQKPDAVLATLPANTLATLWAKQLSRHKPRVLIREANTPSIQASSELDAFDRLVPELAKKWYQRADSIVAVSDGARRDLAQLAGIPNSRITTIYNPVDVDRIQCLAAEPLDGIEKAWLSDPSRPALITAGRLHRQKDHETLLRAFAKVVAVRPCRLIILGEGSLRSELERLRDSLDLEGCVRLPGEKTNPFSYISRSAGFVLSSAWEGFPNALLEALACGCPVVSTDCPSGPSELLADGKFGHLVKVGDSDGLANAILKTLAAPPASREALVTRAREFAPRRIAERYLDLLLDRERT